MLVWGWSRFQAQFWWAAGTLVLVLAAVGWYAAEAWAADQLPGGGSRVGLALGVLGAALIGFELLLWPRKRFFRARTRRFGRTQTWMKAHIWLGLACVPVAVLHAGFRLGGPLATTLMTVFAVVIASGVWGLVLQQVVPRLLLEWVPDEVPAAEIERLLTARAEAVGRQLAVAGGGLGGEPVAGAGVVRAAFEKTVRPYLLGAARPAELRVADRAGRYFADLAAAVPGPARDLVRELEEASRLRRQFDLQARLHGWLHHWLWVHLPLSVALAGLLVAHVYAALRYI